MYGVTARDLPLIFCRCTQSAVAMRGEGALVFLPLLLSHLGHAVPVVNNYTTWRGAKVLNFISLPDPQECVADDNRRIGVCQNPYECRILNGESRGRCALGFGVCCVHTASCGGELSNNVGYFVSPGFPEALHPGSPDIVKDCRLKISKSSPEISQIRLDMVHFILGQPNRRTGVCEQDKFSLRSTSNPRRLRLCGINTGQHFYFDVNDEEDSAEIVIRLTKDLVSRFWEIKITQIEFTERAPSGCLQYFKEPKGLVQTMNFAANGRHLADQDYNICIRQEEGMCSIVYEPCDENSFKIGPATSSVGTEGMTSNTGINPNQPNQLPGTGGILDTLFPSTGDGVAGAPEGTGGILDTLFPSTGDGVAGAPEAPLGDPEAVEDEGSGFGGFNLLSFFGGRSGRQMLLRECDDRIVMPCDSEDLIPVNQQGPGVCDLLHCGNSFCTPEDTVIGGPGPARCKIESSTLPFNIAVHFGPGLREENPEDNLGMCLRYAQQPCS